VKLEIQRRTLTLARPLETSYGAVRERELLFVTITGPDGIPGYGEAAPLEAYDGVSLDQVQRALERYAPVLQDAEGMNGVRGDRPCAVGSRGASQRQARGVADQ
jgi:L-alanine-DL-glutamate epimerase-like enolase superfamily enzyme